MHSTDTITAIATPFGRGSIGVVRVSGPLTIQVAYELLGKLPQSRKVEYLPFLDEEGTIIDQGIALFFLGPNSFTGEDVLELQSHGSPIILDLLIQRIKTFPGVRIARPGEFSERAFLNAKLDLTQAEAIADLINANSVQAARSAIKSLNGAFSSRIYELSKLLTNLRMYIEATIDFPDEEINFFSDKKIKTNLDDIIKCLNKVHTEAYRGSLLREGVKIVIAGQPNVGKSSLLNALAGREVAIVTATAGTTRDVLHEDIHFNGMPLRIFDTAGLREPCDEIESIGIERAWNEIKQADHVLLMIDSADTPLYDPKIIWPEFMNRLPPSMPLTLVRNKADLTHEEISYGQANGYSFITLSVKTGEGIDLLRSQLKKSFKTIESNEGIILARQRHLDALKIATSHLLLAKEHLAISSSEELLAEELRVAQQALNEITGEFSSDDLLESIFSSFCIGK